MSVETMILRFRDLSTNSGETIKFHKERIVEHKYVWWGWWRKAGETVPSEAFRTLMSIIDEKGYLDAFLFDTGTDTLYKAKITQIYWDTRFHEIESPDWNATPSYYGGRKLKAWFKIEEIDKDDNGETSLHEWSYVEVNDLFESRRSIFQDFYNKKICSFEEMKHQNRTIWFIRQYREEDGINEILLYNAPKIKPSDFPADVIENHHSPRLLWLSDLHFSTDHHAFPLQEEMQRGSRLSEAIRKDLEKQGLQEVGGIIITGDLTWRASEEEFDLVQSFLDDIMSWSTLEPNQIIICSGNHDIAFSDEPWKKDKLVSEATEDSKKNFKQFYSRFFSVSPNQYLASGRRFLLARTFVIDVASLNSSTLRQTSDVFQGQGFIGEEQQNLVSEKMNWDITDENVSRPFRIVLLHHHLVPVLPQELAVYEQQSSLVYDAGALCNWVVKHRVNLVLHGHMHHTKIVKESRSLGLVKGNTQWHDFTIASLGSTGVELDHNTLDRRNVYGLLEFSKLGVCLRVREVFPKDPDRPREPTIVNVELPFG